MSLLREKTFSVVWFCLKFRFLSLCRCDYIEVCDWFIQNIVLIVIGLSNFPISLSDYKPSDEKLCDYTIGSQLV